MNEKKLDPFRLSVELDGISDLCACLSLICLNDCDKPTDETLGDALIALQWHLERISEDVGELEFQTVDRDKVAEFKKN